MGHQLRGLLRLAVRRRDAEQVGDLACRRHHERSVEGPGIARRRHAETSDVMPVVAVRLLQLDDEALARAERQRLRQREPQLLRPADVGQDRPACRAALGIAVDRRRRGPAAVRVLGDEELLLLGRERRDEPHLADLGAVALDPAADLGEDEVAVGRTARSLHRKRIVRQHLHPQRDEPGDAVGEAHRVDIRVRVLPARQHGTVVADLQRRAAGGRGLRRCQAHPGPVGREHRELPRLPLREGALQLRVRPVELLLQRVRDLPEPLQFARLVGVRHQHAGLAGADDRLLHVREDRAHGVEIFLRDRVELVVVALRAADRLAEPDGADGADAVGQVACLVVLGLGAAFFGGEEQPVEGRGDLLVLRRLRHQVAGDLLAGEAVERHAVVERADDVVAVRPDVARRVRVVADGVGEAHDIEPADGHAFAVVRRRQQRLDAFRVGIRRRVALEVRDLLRLRRQADQVEVETTREGAAVRFRRRLQAELGDALADQVVDRARPVGDRGLHRRRVRPMALVLGALRDPAAEQLLLGGREGLVGFRRGHPVVLVGRREPADQLALGRSAGDDGDLPGLRGLQGRVAQVETEAALDLGRVRSVAGEAVVRQQRLHVVVEIHLAHGRGAEVRRQRERERGDEQHQPGARDQG